MSERNEAQHVGCPVSFKIWTVVTHAGLIWNALVKEVNVVMKQ
jgi:hypothetical protein